MNCPQIKYAPSYVRQTRKSVFQNQAQKLLGTPSLTSKLCCNSSTQGPEIQTGFHRLSEMVSFLSLKQFLADVSESTWLPAKKHNFSSVNVGSFQQIFQCWSCVNVQSCNGKQNSWPEVFIWPKSLFFSPPPNHHSLRQCVPNLSSTPKHEETITFSSRWSLILPKMVTRPQLFQVVPFCPGGGYMHQREHVKYPLPWQQKFVISLSQKLICTLPPSEGFPSLLPYPLYSTNKTLHLNAT